MAAPGPTYALVALYLLIVYLGPRLMRHRRALDLKAVIAPYSFALVFLNLYMCYEVRATVTCATRYVPPLHVLRGTCHQHHALLRADHVLTQCHKLTDTRMNGSQFFAVSVLSGDFGLTCQAMDYSDNPAAVRVSHTSLMTSRSKAGSDHLIMQAIQS